MIRRANMSSKWGEQLDHLHSNGRENTNVNRRSNYEEGDDDVPSHINYDKIVFSEYSYELLPIRSPRSFKCDSVLKNKHFNFENGDCVVLKNVAKSQEKPAIEKLKRSYPKVTTKEITPLQPQNLPSSLGPTFIPEAISTPKLEKRNSISSLKNNQDILLSDLTDVNTESKPLYDRIDGWERIIKKNQNVRLTKNEHSVQEDDRNPVTFLLSIPENSNLAGKNQTSGSNTKKVATAINNIITQDSSASMKDVITDAEEELRSNDNAELDILKAAKKNENNDFNFKINKASVMAKVREIVKYNFPQACKVNLEDLDDMEDRVSQLEIEVSELKMDELTLPGIKRAHIMTEVLPLSYIQELPESNITDKSSNCHLRAFEKLNVLQKTQLTAENAEEKLRGTNVKENLEDGGKITQPSLVGPNENNHPNCDESVPAQNKNGLLEESCITDIKKYSIAASESEWNTSEVNYNTLRELSLNDQSLRSFHSSDFSFSCSCSTSVSQSSFPYEIPNESLPFLILQNLSYKNKSKNISRKSKCITSDVDDADNIDSAINCDSENDQSNRKEFSPKELKVNQLHRKVSIESTIMEQASKALTLCYSSLAFSCSPQQIEGERLLLLSTIRKQAILDEIRRLEVETTSFPQKTDCIEVGIEKIHLFLRDDFLLTLSPSKQHASYYFVCVVSYHNTVLSTDVAIAKQEQTSIEFQPNNIKIEGQWCDDFWICFRVYVLQVAQVGLEKGRSRRFQRKTSESNTEKHASIKCNPCGTANSDCRLNHLQNNAKTQHVIRIPSFVLIARTDLHLPDDLHHTSFILQQYEPCCDDGNHFKLLHETAHLQLSCTFKTTSFDIIVDKYIPKKYKGFLTRFSIIGGNGAWQREWWCLKGTYLLSWRYPEDEECLPPMRVMDLKLSTEKVLPMPRVKCARRNTFSIKLKADGNMEGGAAHFMHLPNEGNPFSASETEHILSADTREERDGWCTKLNAVLRSLESWSVIQLPEQMN